MKKVFTIFALVAISLGSFAQTIDTIPNGSFENWTSPTNPDQWSTLANIFGPSVSYFAVQDTTAANVIAGTSSLKMRTDSVPSQGILRSYVGLGSASAPTGAPVFTGVAYSKRPDTLYFAYKYVPGAAGDSALVTLGLSKAGAQMFGNRFAFLLPRTDSISGQWAGVGIPLSSYYTVSGNPDSLYMLFKSGKSAAGAAYGSTLWVDDIYFTAKINTDITNINGDVAGVNAFPNPATDRINIAIEASEVGSQIQLFDMSGREVYSGILSSTTATIDTRNLEAGVYAIRVNSIDKLTTYKGKISISK